MKKIIVYLLVLSMLAFVLTGCSNDGDSGNGGSGSEEVVELKLGHIQSENDIWHEGALKFKEVVEEKSNGSMTVTIYPNSTLGGDRDMAEGLQIGTLDFALIAGVLGNFEPSIQLLELPYLFDNYEEYSTVIHGEIGQQIADKVLDASGIRILTFWDRGARHVTSNKPINSLADIQGLKIRLPEIKAMSDTWAAMGAAPTTMAWNEVYTGLEQKVIEAQENPIPFIYGGRIHEVQDYLALTAHKYEYVTIAMSDLTWQSLTDEQKAIVEEAAQASTEFENGLLEDTTQELLDKMVDEGLTVTTPDTAEFAAAAKAAHEEFAKTIDIDLYNDIVEAIE
ncbi:TRAP transporter substrate-binding protein [Alkalibacter mobilis]|uniref:TRAP transporter substrate-binding protein n=1 Tax=Alkalibacter mobilis TaxID=2787712 RepID=UPI00189EDA0D|nr:TRAP transporter substrate-binding protein [Alkalibacter mobilis]MBF7095635.1 TRAP transporter substrate-binding protein [Alkalibacter mobilis]